MNAIIKQIKTIPLLLLGLVFTSTVSAQQVLTLKEALNYAVQNNVRLRKAKLDIDGGRYKTEEIRAQALPQITGNAGLNYNPIIGQIVFGDNAITLGKTWNSSAGIQLSQQVFNQQVFTGLQAAKSSEEYYLLMSTLTEEQIIEMVANNYYQALVNRQQLALVESNIKNVTANENAIAGNFKNGLAKKIDVDRIRVRLTNLHTQKEQILNSITQLENQLKFAMGMPVSKEISLPKTELSEVIELPQFADTVSLENRTEIKILNTQDKLLSLQRKAYVSEYYPTLALSGNYTYASQSPNFDFLKSNSAAIGYGASAIGLTLKVPIFNGFLTRSKIRQADIDIKKANEDRRESVNSLNLAYENAKSQLRYSLNAINAQKKNADLADDIYKSTQNNYNNGLASLTDLLDTESSLTEAQNSYTQALLNYKIAEIQLIKSNGNIKSLLQ